MADPILYSWDDASGPGRLEAVSTSNRSLVDLLKACLVDGYTGKAAAGWTEEYSDLANGKLVLRNNTVTGTGTYVRVVNGNGVSGTGLYGSKIQAYDTMSDIDTGTHMIPREDSSSAHISVYQRYGESGIDERGKWWLLADDRAFYFFSNMHSTDSMSGGTPLFAGDIKSFFGGDSTAFVLHGRYVDWDANTYPYTNFGKGDTNLANSFIKGLWLRATTRNDYSVRSNCCAYPIYNNDGLDYTGNYNGEMPTYPEASTGGVLLGRFLIADGYHDETVDQDRGAGYRGLLPGAYWLWHNVDDLTDAGFVHGDTITGMTGQGLEGKTLMFVNYVRDSYTSARSALFLQLGDWWV